MRFGLFTGLTGTTWDAVLGLWRHVEAAGWDAACVTDLFLPTFVLPKDPRPLLDRFMAEVAPAFRR